MVSDKGLKILFVSVLISSSLFAEEKPQLYGPTIQLEKKAKHGKGIEISDSLVLGASAFVEANNQQTLQQAAEDEDSKQPNETTEAFLEAIQNATHTASLSGSGDLPKQQ